MNNLFFKKAKKFIFLNDVFYICNQPYKKNFDKKIFGVNNIKDANNTEITFFNNLNYEKEAKNCKALVCIVNEKNVKYLNKDIIFIISKNKLKFVKKKIFLGKNTLIDKSANIGSNTIIGNNVIIKANVHIGKNCTIGSNVIIENSLLGDNIIIKSGTLIGQVGFGFNFEKKKKIKFPHIGRVIIENDVQIGSFCTIDRGSLTDTVIGEFTSIDNQVQIAHNVKIGNFCMIAAQSGIAGSTIIGNNVKIGGQTGISGHLSIGNHVKIGGKSGVTSNIKDNQIVMGYPAKSIRDFLNNKKQ
jgi:UDP-3-O-[3-hydroxymyristoyl] glucosamine N-acyltransferase